MENLVNAVADSARRGQIIDAEAASKISQSVRWTMTNGEIVIMDMEGNMLYGIEGVAAAIWIELDRGKSLAEITGDLCGLYEASRDELQADIINFTTSLREAGLINPVNPI